VWKLLKLGRVRGGSGEIPEELLPGFVKTYSRTVKKGVDFWRNYSQQRMKDFCFTWHKQHGNTLPTAAAILACACRNGDNDELMIWYWEVVLTNTVTTHNWPAAIHRCKTISGACRCGNCDLTDPRSDSKCKPIITTNTEAFAVLVFESCRDKWLAMFPKMEEARAAGKKFNYRAKDLEEEEKMKYKGNYTDQDCGQQEWGGFNQPGVKRFNEIVGIIMKAHASMGKKEKHKHEKVILNKIQLKHGIECATQEEQKRLARNRKRYGNAAPVPPPAKKTKIVSCLSDSEDDEEDE
jgi:hypothetical protein